jgi:hypothetical protein
MPDPSGARSGYEVRFRGAQQIATAYTVELSKCTSGHRTLLATVKGVSLPVNATFALSEQDGEVVVWTGLDTLTPILSAANSAYSDGYVGIEANRGEGTAYDFRAGNVAE